MNDLRKAILDALLLRRSQQIGVLADEVGEPRERERQRSGQCHQPAVWHGNAQF